MTLDLTTIWERFSQCLDKHQDITSVSYKKITGIPFLYVKSNLNDRTVLNEIRSCSNCVTTGLRISYKTTYVRNDNDILIFRHRFYVPQEKLFCCGNECIDCIRFMR